MSKQLVLIDEPAPEWRLDDDTRATGLRGLAKARAALGPRQPADADAQAA
jgi:hypothetical protein